MDVLVGRREKQKLVKRLMSCQGDGPFVGKVVLKFFQQKKFFTVGFLEFIHHRG